MKQPEIRYLKWKFRHRGITLPPLGIFVRSDHRNNRKVLNHENVHWQQYQQMGLWMFYYTYIMQWLKYGYDRMPMEIEARYEEDEYAKKHYSKVYLSGKNNYEK